MAQSSGPGISKEMYSVLQSLDENFKLVIENLEAGEAKESAGADYSLDGFWSKLGNTVKSLSAESTKFCLAFSQSPVPSAKEAEPLIDGMSRSILAMVSVYYALPAYEGDTLRKAISSSLISIVKAARQLIEVIRLQGPQGSLAQLQTTGTVWGFCDDFPTLPKNNCEAVHRVGESSCGLVKDAVTEMKEARDEKKASMDDPEGEDNCMEEDEGMEEDEPQWSEQEFEMTMAALNLMKLSHGIPKKALENIKKNGDCTSAATNAELDKLAELMHRVSPLVDDFAAVVYPPVEKEEMHKEAEQLFTLLQAMHSSAVNCHIMEDFEEEINRWQFMETALNHNYDKIIKFIQS